MGKLIISIIVRIMLHYVKSHSQLFDLDKTALCPPIISDRNTIDLEWAAPKVSAAHVQGLENNERHFKDVLGGNGGDISALILFRKWQKISETLQTHINHIMREQDNMSWIHTPSRGCCGGSYPSSTCEISSG